MKYASKLLVLAIAIAILAGMSVAALAEYGSGAVTDGQTYTTEQMLVYAIQDEYMALAEYQAINEKFGASRPFTSLIQAEQRHIDLLKPLFAEYGVTVPENDAASRVTAPETLALAYEAGLKAETGNIAMYVAFLAQTLPDDLKATFTSLKAASENHLSAFTRKSAGQTGNMQGNRGGRGNRNGNGNAAGCGNGNAAGGGMNSSGRGRMSGGNCANGANGSCAACPANPAA